MIVSILISLLFSANVGNPVELGKVSWLRNYDEAIKQSQKQDKPIFLLFQEVPGCSTCQKYGNRVLSHPLIVEAIEDEFIPLAIYNNLGGKDRKVLEKYNEPTWNNPVVRIINAKGENVVRRLYGNYSPQGVVNTMIDALHKTHKIVPEYLNVLREELEDSSGTLKESYLSMYCFWTGEKVIGDMDGVVSTEAGFMDGREVVKFTYNPSVVEYREIVKNARTQKCADGVYSNDDFERSQASKLTRDGIKSLKNYRTDRQPKYYLSNTTFQYIPMSAYQAMKINTALGGGHVADDLLSPRQQTLLRTIERNRNNKWKVLYNQDFYQAWWALDKTHYQKS